MIKNREDYKSMILSYHDALEYVDKNTLLISVDNHKPSLAISRSLLEKVKNKVIIDYHSTVVKSLLKHLF